MKREYNIFDKLCLGFDQAIRSMTNNAHTTGASYPAKGVAEASLSEQERKHAAALMRINHAGEVCAQALYHGQGVVSNSLEVQEKLQHAAIEEGDHLAWCKQRLDELGSHPSYLTPLWYMGSFCIGIAAGVIGDDWSLGFLAETERQVIKHLAGHQESLPEQDQRSQAILQKMEADEARHRDDAVILGAKELPAPVKKVMGLTSKVMVKIAYVI